MVKRYLSGLVSVGDDSNILTGSKISNINAGVVSKMYSASEAMQYIYSNIWPPQGWNTILGYYDVLSVGGGGGGGVNAGAGGGGGGVLYIQGISVIKNETLTITVGTGGAGATAYPVAGTNGGSSGVTGFNNYPFGSSITSLGGGGGSTSTTVKGSDGGSGGGGGAPADSPAPLGAFGSGYGYPGIAGSTQQGFPGSQGGGSGGTRGGGGGGGASQAGGSNPGANQGSKGGDGAPYFITGANVLYAGGGGGGSHSGPGNPTNPGRGGAGGGGDGGLASGGLGNPGVNGIGGGAGGGGGIDGNGGRGGNGCVIFKVYNAAITPIATGSNVVITNSGSNVCYTFYSPGTFVW